MPSSISPDAQRLMFTEPGPRVQTTEQYLTSCRIEGTGSADGTTISQASITCSGPNTPVQLLLSQELQRYQKGFSGVDVLPGFAEDSALVQIQNAANLAIVDSVISNIPGNLVIQNSTVQVLRSTFILNSGAAAGAMTIQDSQITGQSSVGITNTTFIGNVDGNSQGGAFAVAQGGLVQVVNSRFAANSASRGGAIYSEGASLTIMNSQFNGNTATTTGGAMYVAQQSALTILNSTFSGNIAGGLGGAVAVDTSQATVGGSVFSDNSAKSQGGALYQTNTTGDVTTCTFMSNTALNGGAIYQNMASGNILRTAFTDNIAGQKGGALFGETSTGNIMNSTFTMNRASQAGGAVFLNNCASSMSFSVFTLNDAGQGSGGAVYRVAGFT
ncbi:g474 [Coccomyxa viridis]|uniref:G474 protein n=1 Tax=Coccomyxa viridis TaxID=1274662 RepID=A0ABP1FMG3_9CHLO